MREIDSSGSSNASRNNTSVATIRTRNRRGMDENQLTFRSGQSNGARPIPRKSVRDANSIRPTIVARRLAPRPELPDEVIEISSDTGTIDLVSSSDDDDEWRSRLRHPIIAPRGNPQANVEERQW